MKSMIYYIIQISNQQTSHMNNQKEKTFQRTSITLGKKAPIFNLEVLQQMFNQINCEAKGNRKVKAQNYNKPSRTINRLSLNKQTSKSKPQRASCAKKEKKEHVKNVEKRMELSAEEITGSEIYKALKQQYLHMKNDQYCQRKQLKKSIQQLNKSLRNSQNKTKEVEKMKNSLIREVNTLSRTLDGLRLRNYDLKCELYTRFGYQQYGFYDSEPDADNDSEINYEEMLELQQQVGTVNIGYPRAVIEKIPTSYFDRPLQPEEKCCICCMEFQQDDAIFTAECSHVHHHQCIQKWLQVKRICPLCRQEIVIE